MPKTEVRQCRRTMRGATPRVARAPAPSAAVVNPASTCRLFPRLLLTGWLSSVLLSGAWFCGLSPATAAEQPVAGEQEAGKPAAALPGLLWRLDLSLPAGSPAARGDDSPESPHASSPAVRSAVSAWHFAPAQCRLAVGTPAGQVILVDLRQGTVSQRIPRQAAASTGTPPAVPVRQVRFDAAQPGLLHILTDRALSRWQTADLPARRVAKLAVPLPQPATGAEVLPLIAGGLSADGSSPVMFAASEPVVVLAGSDLAKRTELDRPIEVDALLAVPRSTGLVATRFGRLYRWDGASGERLWKARLESRIRGVCLDGTARRIVALADYIGFQTVDAATGQVLSQLPDPERRAGNGTQTMAIAVAPDGTFFASGRPDGAVEVWDEVTGLRLYRLAGHTAPVVAVSFLRNGQAIVSLDARGTVLCHDLFSADFRLKRVAEATAGRSAAAALRATRSARLWDALGSPDGRMACGAALALAADEATALAVIADPPSARPEVLRLIDLLGSPEFHERRTAYRRLRELALTAEEELRNSAAAADSIEAASRIRRLLARLQGPDRDEQREQKLAGENRRWLLAARILQWIGTPAARARLEEFRRGNSPGGARAAAEAGRVLSWLAELDANGGTGEDCGTSGETP